MKYCVNCHKAIITTPQAYDGARCFCIVPVPQVYEIKTGGGCDSESGGGGGKRLIGLTAEKPFVDLTFDEFPDYELGNKEFLRGVKWAVKKFKEKNK